MKGIMYQQNLAIILDTPTPLKEIHIQVLEMRKAIGGMSKRIERQGALLREAAGFLKDIQTILFEAKQGALFDDERIETVNTTDDIECKNEVFEELRELLGNEQAEKAADYFSGSLVYFSKHIMVARKYREIRKAFQEGAAYRDLSVTYGYTEQHIRNIVHKEAKVK